MVLMFGLPTSYQSSTSTYPRRASGIACDKTGCDDCQGARPVATSSQRTAEQEADRVAEQVGSMPTPLLAPKDGGQAPVQRQAEHEIQQGGGAVQRKLAGGLEKVTLEGFKSQLSAKGIKLNHGQASKLFKDV